MLSSLSSKVAIVTGGGRGIGRAVAIGLGRKGASVVVNYAGNHEAAAETVKAVEAADGNARAVQGKLEGEASVAALFEATLATFGRIDILVINAAIARFAPIGTVTEAEFDATVAVNMKAPFFCLQNAAKHMAEGGRIVSISAAMTTVGRPNTILYAGTKAALEQFSLAAAKELGPRGITVNTVLPGATETELYFGLSTEASRAEAAKRSPFGRIGEPKDIADVVVFLCSEEARWLSGQTLVANGGAVG